MLLWLLWSLEVMLAYSKTAFTLGALKTYSPGNRCERTLFSSTQARFRARQGVDS